MSGPTDSIRVCTANVRYDTSDDEFDWSDRRPRIVDAVADVDPDLLGLQEPLAHQYDQLRGSLSGSGADETALEFHGVGRRDGARDGEFVPVAWNPTRFDCLETGVFWLSETPERPSVGWDADLPRVATWAVLRERSSGTGVWFCNVHLDHRGERARLEAARLLRRRATARLDSDACDAAVLTGDCNAPPGSPPHRELTTGPLTDARREAAAVIGPAGTFHGFDGSPGERIDYVFVSSALDVERYRTLEPASPPRSDHLPVVADLSSR